MFYCSLSLQCVLFLFTFRVRVTSYKIMAHVNMVSIPPVTRICHGVIRILGLNPGPMTLQGTNTYLIGGGKRRILLDAGEDNKPQYVTNLKTVLQEENALLEHIVITHWHHDHIGGVRNVLREIDNGKDVSVWKFPRTDGDEESGIDLRFLKDGDEIKTDDVTLRVVHTPGHTTDHVILMNLASGEMFSGDNVLGAGTAVFEDLYLYMNSLQKMLDLNPKVILPAHGPIVEDPTASLRHYIDHRNMREAQILAFLQDSPDDRFTPLQIVEVLYKDVNPKLYSAAAFNVSHHLGKLLKEKKVIFIDDSWQISKPGSSL